MKPIQTAFYEINRFRSFLFCGMDSELGPISTGEYIERRRVQLEAALKTAAHYIHATAQFDPILELTEEQRKSILESL